MMDRPIDLRTDTITRPGKAMRTAMARAEVGDDQKREDPTVAALERRVALLLGHEAALFMPSATMANQIGLRLLGHPGDEILAERSSHVFTYELGGPAVHSGLMAKPISGVDGQFTPDQVSEAFTAEVWDRSGTSVLSIENTHAESGGRVWDVGTLRAVVDRARELGLRLHLDGARLMNASVAAGVTPAALAASFDVVTLCLSKGLGCPVGALLVSSGERVEQARRHRMRFGGALRQAGILAAAGLYALDHLVDRLAEDHANARLLSELIGPPLGLAAMRVDSNIVLVDVGSLGLSTRDSIDRLADVGVLVSSVARPGVLRAVTHLDVSEREVRVAARRIVAALSAPRPTSDRAA